MEREGISAEFFVYAVLRRSGDRAYGGWQGPLLPPFIWFALKTAFFMMMFILIRASLPRPRYDQVMSFGWKICLPLTLINLLVTAAVILWQAQ